MSLTFYYVPMSTSSITEAVLHELGIDYHGIEMNIDRGDTKTKEFLSINPNGRVPVIVHEGVVIWESIAITLYLGENFGVENRLYPSKGPQRGEAMKWVVWANLSLADASGKLAAQLPPEAPGAVLAGSKDFIPLANRRVEDLHYAKKAVMECFKILDQALLNKEYLLGAYSVVDTHLFVLVAWSMSMELDLSNFDALMSWFSKCSKRKVLSSLFED